MPKLGGVCLAGPGGADRETDGSRHRLMLPYGGEHNNLVMLKKIC